MKPIFIITLPLVLISLATQSYSLPLSTRSRYIVDEETGERVKLACANWAGHLSPMLPEGLDKQPLSHIARHIALMGFNCVRLTWAIHMFTRHSNLTVAQSLQDLGLTDAIAAMSKHNPQILSLTVVDAQKAVIEQLGEHGVMVVLDNHVSQPMWCCNENDGNGFFGDKYFDPKEWLQGLAIVAHRYKNTPMVVAMSMRNELRGPLQNESVWYNYMEKGARIIHRANPNLLVIFSGLDYDLEFRFLNQRPLRVNLKNKLVYETHRYAFSEGQDDFWLNQPLNKVCDNVTQEINQKAGFLLEGKNAAPLFISEFGINQLGINEADNVFLSCFLSYLAEKDLDWAVWAFQGSYYFREGKVGTEETYGMMNSSWKTLRSPEFHSKLQLIQRKIQDPNSKNSPYYVMYHPKSGRCVGTGNNDEVYAGDCRSLSKWSHDGDGTPIRLKGTLLCLTAVGDGLPVALSTNCMSEQSAWKIASNSNYQLSNKDGNGNELCLEWDSNYSGKILTKKCIGLEDEIDEEHPKYYENPQTQWFKLITANV